MKEKTADIDILEDLLSTQKQYIEDKDYQKEHNIKEQAIDYAKMWTKATETLIAENKELKSEIQHKNDQMLLQDREIDRRYIKKTEIEKKIEELENIKLCSDDFFKLITENKIKLLQSLLGKE